MIFANIVSEMTAPADEHFGVQWQEKHVDAGKTCG
jgi:hypothetical protein